MKIVPRLLEPEVMANIGKNKVLLVMGTRRVGKTFLLKSIESKIDRRVLRLNGEDLDIQETLSNLRVANYTRIIGDAEVVFIDEAQAVPEIGKALKLMIDSFPQLTIVATGSSSFDLLNKAGEPLTGRKISFHLYPLAQAELHQIESPLETQRNLEERLILGSYPELIQMETFRQKSEYLLELIQSYLLKDILSFEGIRQPDKILRLLRLIAYQVGSEVSYNELGTQLGMSKNTVEHYLDLLGKVFIIYRLPAYSTNHRKEISKGSKWYFFDNGIRNAIINDFKLLSLRNDVGALWENYLVSERIKINDYRRENVEYYFWRGYNQQEVDLVEVRNGNLTAFEFKYSSDKKTKIPSAFATTYPDAPFERISRDNYLEWIG
jgi:predicted AAA+ superfamily ATPase